MKVRFNVNGEAVEVEARANEMLLDVLRRELGLTSVRYTCGVGVCGACTVLVDGEPISTCILLALLAQGKEITTVEGLGGEHPVQRAFVEAEAFQCGYCTPWHDPHSQEPPRRGPGTNGGEDQELHGR